MEDGGQPAKRHDKLGYGLTKFEYIPSAPLVLRKPMPFRMFL